MSQNRLEERVATLEKKVAALGSVIDKLAEPKDWRSAIGMFAGDEEGMKQIFEAGRKIREKDRQRARKGTQPKRRRATS